MTFEVSPPSDVTSTSLRELEQSAPNVTPKAIRAALVQAAKELEDHESTAAYCVRLLEEALSLKVSVMDSQSRAHEIDRRVKQAIGEAVTRLRG